MADLPALHGPSRPDWNCVACGAEWPCITRKRQVRELFAGDRGRMVTYMSAYLLDAHADLGHLSTIAISDRIVGWCTRLLRRRSLG